MNVRVSYWNGYCFGVFDQSPRRNCCKVRNTKRKGTMMIDVGECREDEVVEL
jgi:hypothetical protein